MGSLLVRQPDLTTVFLEYDDNGYLDNNDEVFRESGTYVNGGRGMISLRMVGTERRAVSYPQAQRYRRIFLASPC